MPVELRGVVFKGLYETHIDVVDLDRSVGFYEDVLQLELGAKLAVDAARADSDGSEPFDDSNSFVEVYRRQPDGSWKSIWDIWNSTLPLP